MLASAALAQHAPPTAAGQGEATYKSNCAFCHGMTGHGGRGPDLTSGRLGTDEAVRNAITKGVPGTPMPSFNFEKDEMDALIEHLRKLASVAVPHEVATGDPAKGREIYKRNGCSGCHRIGLEGVPFGPDLSRVGLTRSLDYLRESIVDPSADISPDYEGVTAVLRDRSRVTGVRVNEDTFTLQLRDGGQFRMYQKSDLADVIHEKKSLMPDFRLRDADMNDLLAYLSSQRGQPADPPVSLDVQLPYERIVNARKEPRNWLTYWGDYSAVRHRDLKQIHTGNVKDLRVEWMFQTGQTGAFETVPLVVDGVMYLTAHQHVYALDPRSGRQLWHYQHQIPESVKLTNGTINRGLAMLGDRLFMATADARLISLDSRTGKLIWNTEIMSPKQGYAASLSPLAVKDKIIVGVAGGEFGIRGLIDAYDAMTGKRAWRFWTIPAKEDPGGDTWLEDSWKRGGGATWMTGTFDPELNTLYWGVGNPGADLYGENRIGDNLYSCSLLALDPDTGKRKWHFQFTPHDTHDWDATETPMLLDLKWKGAPRKVVVQANRNGFFYVLDRATGEFLMARPFARQTWAKEIDRKGRPILMPGTEPTPDGNRLCPGLAGAANWMAPSYNPDTGWFYFPVREQCDVYYSVPPAYSEGKLYWGGAVRGVTDEKEWGLLKALDPLTGETRWDFRYYRAPWAGTMSTSGGLIFAGDEDGWFMALDAKTGKNLWKINTGNRIVTAPITYVVEGRQYVALPSGSALIAFALP